tara:strand:+ start:9070 stop:9771 length:702 start_codon:yes stop_codon:yes gene_type:complete
MRRAIILAGGKGSRLRPYTIVLPKPLMPIGDFPILEVVVRQLVRDGFDHISMAVNHQASLIRAFFGDGSKWSIKIDYYEEDKPMGTMGSLNKINDLPDNFLIMNGDILTDLNYSKFYDYHLNNKSLFTIGAKKRIQPIDYGVLESNQKGFLQSFVEKPKKEFLVSMGIYMANKNIKKYIPNSFYGFDNLMLDLLSKNRPVKLYEFNSYWLDIGKPDDYIKAIDDFEVLKDKLL